MRFSSSLRSAAAVAVSCAAIGARGALFEPLFVAGKVVGGVVVVRPDGSRTEMKEAHAYPYGSRIEVPEALTRAEKKAAAKAGLEVGRPQATVSLSPDFRFRIGPGSKVAILDEPAAGEDGETFEHKTVDVEEGTVTAIITAVVAKTGGAADAEAERNLRAVSVRTPIGEAVSMSEQNQISVARSAAPEGGWACRFSAPTGKMQVKGRQFSIHRLKHNTEVAVEGTEDFTRIFAARGEFSAVFEKGADATQSVPFKTRMVGKILRQYAAVGHRMAVSVMVSFPPAKPDADGELLSYNYLEGQTGVGVEGRDGAAAGGESAADGDNAGSDDGFGDFGDGDSGGFDGFGDGDSGKSGGDAAGGGDAFAGFDEW